MAQSVNDGHLGFTFRRCKDGSVEIHHHGRLAATLRGTEAQDFLNDVPDATTTDAQQLMARVTGNYKRGNERTAARHPRNVQ